MKGTILLVEDEVNAREVLALVLERAGYRAIAAGGGDEALLLARTSGFLDVIVTDVVLGTDDRRGLRLMSELRAIGVGAPVIVITAFADVERVKFALNQGAAYLLEKPFRGAELIAVIERVRAHGGDVAHAIARVLESAQLTEKERTVARHLFNGLSSSEIATAENNSAKTIRQHVTQIYAKCGVGTRAEFLRLVYVRG